MAAVGISVAVALVVGVLFVGIWGVPFLVSLPVMLGAACFAMAVGMQHVEPGKSKLSAWLSFISILLLLSGAFAIGFSSVD